MSTSPSSILDSSPSTVGCPPISSSTEALTVPAASDKGADEGKEGGRGAPLSLDPESDPLEHLNLKKPLSGTGCLQFFTKSAAQRQREASKYGKGRRAKRAMKYEDADKAAAAKHEQHLQRLGLK